MPPFETLLETPHALPASEVLARLDVAPAMGLDDAEVKRRIRACGQNTIVSRRRVSALSVFAHQFKSPVVYLLGAAAALAFYFGEWEEGTAIAAVLALNALIGFLTELKAARSIEALRALGTRSAARAARRLRTCSLRPSRWCRAISCCWKPAIRSPPTCG